MGGRGGGGGTSGGTTSKLPALIGSEKQVSWAESIRASVFDNLTAMQKTIEKRKGEIKYISEDKAKQKEAEDLLGYSSKNVRTAREYYSTFFQRVTSASEIIDKRAEFSANQVDRAVRAEKSRGALSRVLEMVKKQRAKR